MTAPETGKRHLTIRIFLVIYLVIGLVIAGTAMLLYKLETGEYLSRLKIEERMIVHLQAKIVIYSLEDVVSDLMVLSRLNELMHWFDSDEQHYTDEMAWEYLTFSRQKGRYDQIRFIDTSGMEKVRVNFNNGVAAIVPGDRLADKSQRYYFKDTLALSKEEFFVSAFDLNVEKGRIETPHKPMIRFGIPVFDGGGHKRGVVVLNYLGGRILDGIRKAGELSDGDTMLVNAAGYWLSSPQPEDEWGFMIDARSRRKFSTNYPRAWRSIAASSSDQIHTQNGLFTATTVYPLKKGVHASSKAAAVYGSHTEGSHQRSYTWKIISHIPPQQLRAATFNLRSRLIFITLALFTLAIAPAWFFAQLLAKRKRYQAELYRSANYDKLTDLPNRSLFMDRLHQMLKQSRRYERRFALLFIDLDGFKAVNDTLGHAAGDDLLGAVADRLTVCVRESDTVARLGGDEFTIILSDINNPEGAAVVARKIINTIAATFDIKGNEARIGASIGVSVYPDHGDDTDILLKKADDAMYLAKQQGKNDFRMSEG